MSFEVPKAHVQEFGANVLHLAQQRGSRLRNFVDVESGIVGTRFSFDYIGVVEAKLKISRHEDTPLTATPHVRRILDLTDYEYSDLVDKEDKIRMIFDPTNEYVIAGMRAHGRRMDRVILAAANGTAQIGSDTGLGLGSAEAFPAAQNFTTAVATSVGIADLITARGKLRKAEVIQDDEPIVCACSSDSIDNLLNEPEIQSIDQNTVRALTMGEVASFMGFTFVQTELVSGVGTATEKLYFWPKSGIRLGIGRDITALVERRPDKSYSWNPYVSMSIGATRTQSNNVVTATVDHS